MKQSTLGSYIRFLRTQNQLTQSQLAEKLNVTDKAVWKWERDLSYPDIFLFPKLADTLGVNVSDLLNGGAEDGQPSRLEQIFEISHDFRMPLHVILGCTDLMENHLEDKEQLEKCIRNIRASGEYLLKKIDTVMRTADQNSDITAGEPADETGELADYLKRLKETDKKAFGGNDFSGKRILIAEDIEISRDIIGEILKQSGAEIEFAEDGEICLEKVTAAPGGYYDLILMDIVMPNMDGIEATRRIRKLDNERKASIPIIAVSANIFEKDRIAAMDAGNDAFAENPIFVEKLFGIMKEVLQGDAS